MAHFMEVILNGQPPTCVGDVLRAPWSAHEWRVLEARPPQDGRDRQMLRVEGPPMDFFALDGPEAGTLKSGLAGPPELN